MSIPKSKRPKSRPDTASGRGHYFDPQPAVASRRHAVRFHMGELALELQVDRGVFAYRGVDLGTQTLLREAPPPPPTGEILDLGCGYGPIAVTLARRSPAARVWAVDINERALELTRLNAAAARVENVMVGTPDEVPENITFDAIYSNPPIRSGKALLHELLLRWLGRLKPAGSAYLVVQRNLGSDSLAAWLSGQGIEVRRLKSKKGYRILEVVAGLS